MAKEKFKEVKITGSINVACKFDDGTIRYWSADKKETIKNIVSIVAEYVKEGYRLTLRQLHYQFVSNVEGYVNHDSAYKKLGNILDDCRYGGLIDWSAIEDRGRRPHILYSVSSIHHALTDTVDQYRLDRQKGQSNLVELWSEKDALSGILGRTTEKYHIKLVVNKGYTSSSAAYAAYKRCLSAIENNQTVTILYFGDHDPSGLDMVRDIRDRLLFFLANGEELKRSERVNDWWLEGEYNMWDLEEHIGEYGKFEKLMNYDDDDLTEEFEAAKVSMYLKKKKILSIIPIGLTMDQIKKYKLPTNPTKLTDSRADKYIKQFGKVCWEVDALKPQVLTSIIETNIKKEIDIPLYESVLEEEENHIAELGKIIKKYENKK